MVNTKIWTKKMTDKFKILGKYIKDMSSETKDTETYKTGEEVNSQQIRLVTILCHLDKKSLSASIRKVRNY